MLIYKSLNTPLSRYLEFSEDTVKQQGFWGDCNTLVAMLRFWALPCPGVCSGWRTLENSVILVLIDDLL